MVPRFRHAYLSDVSAGPDWINAFQLSKWFQRGWTLQELVAPSVVHFYSREWDFLGTREGLADLIAQITSIDPILLCPNSVDSSNHISIDVMLDSFSAARRMSWAAKRHTTREEDIAFCLIGIFNINMPLLYDEGKRAFLRLQEEIVKVYNDQSILAWEDPQPSYGRDPTSSLFASHPSSFHKGIDVSLAKTHASMVLDSRGLELEVELVALKSEPQPNGGIVLAVLQGRVSDNYLSRPAIVLNPIAGVEGMFRRDDNSPLYVFSHLATPQIQPSQNEVCFAQLEEWTPETTWTAEIASRTTKIILKNDQGRLRWFGLRREIVPPLTFALEHARSGIDGYKAIASVPRLKCESSTVIGENWGAWTLPLQLLMSTKSSRNFRLCGVMHFKCHDKPGFFMLWGVEDDFSTSKLEPGWWADFRPFVILTRYLTDIWGFPASRPSLSCSDSIGQTADTQMELDQWVRNFTCHRITRSFKGLEHEWEGEQGTSDDTVDSSQLGIELSENDGTLSVSAGIRPVIFLARTAYHLTLKFDISPC